MPETAEDPSVEYLHKGGVLRGKGLFQAVEYEPPYEQADPEFPFVLSTGRTLYHYNAATQTRRSEGLSGKQPEAFVEIHPKDARDLGVEDGEIVAVLSRRGSLRCRALVSRQVRRHVLWMPFHFPEARTNRLTTDAGDKVTGTGEYKVCAARIDRVVDGNAEQVFPGAYARVVR